MRVSTDKQDEKYGKKLQESAIRKMIESRNIPEMENSLVFAGEKYVYYDDGVSGTINIEERPQFSKMMMDYKMAPKDNKPFDAVAVYKIDRLARKLKILIDVIEFLQKREIELISVHENIDTSTPFGRAMLNIMGVIAELEVETIKERTKSGRNQAADMGVFMGNSPPLGYKKDKNKKLIIAKEEAKIINQIFNLFVKVHESPTKISNILTENEIMTPAGFSYKNQKRKGKYAQVNKIYKWNDNMVRIILNNEIYTGTYYYNKTKNSKILPKKEWTLSLIRHPQIIDKTTFKRAQKRMEVLKISKNDSNENNYTYLLSGLLTCDSCSNFTDHKAHWNGLKQSRKKKVSFYYKCGRKSSNRYSKTCTTIPLPGKEIEDYIVSYTKNLLSNPMPIFKYQKKLKSTKNQKKILDTEIESLRKKLNSIPQRKENILKQHELNHIGTNKLNNDLKDIEKERAKLEKRMNELQISLSKQSLDSEYSDSLKLFSKKYKKDLDKNFKNRKKTKEILNFLYEEIIIYSRPIKKSDIIAGRKKDNQEIPYKIHMRMKLPAEILEKALVLTDIDGNLKEKPVKKAGGSGHKFDSCGR